MSRDEFTDLLLEFTLARKCTALWLETVVEWLARERTSNNVLTVSGGRKGPNA